jgi:hypothetical protein
MTFKEKVISKLCDLRFDIKNEEDNIVGHVELITEKDIFNEELIEKITTWRKNFKDCFLTEFEPTVDRTRKWLKESLIPNPDRLLFKVYTTENILVGHIGAIARKDILEYDYYILGAKVPIRNFAILVAKRLLVWLATIEDVDYIMANVRSDNLHALDFHKRTGFSIGEKIPLKKIIHDNNEISFEKDMNIQKPELYLIKIEANKSNLS